MNNLSDKAREHVNALRRNLKIEGPMSVLHISNEWSSVTTSNNDEELAFLKMEIGAERSARELLRYTPPRRQEFEMAIEPIEDEIIRIHRSLPKSSTLVTDSEEIREIALMAGHQHKGMIVLQIDEMERVFSRLAAVIQGKPARAEGIPESNSFAIRLLILREFMHHLNFSKIIIVDSGTTLNQVS